MPSSTGVIQAFTGSGCPFTSTRHRLQWAPSSAGSPGLSPMIPLPHRFRPDCVAPWGQVRVMTEAGDIDFRSIRSFEDGHAIGAENN